METLFRRSNQSLAVKGNELSKLNIHRLLSPSQLFKVLNYSLNSWDIALPQVVVFFYHHFRTVYEFSCIYYVLWVVQYAEQCFQIVWLCNILDITGLPDYLDILNFYIISKHTKINHNSCFGWFWEDLHENKIMFILACQSMTSWDALLKSAATWHLLIASTQLLSCWVSIRHPCHGVTLCDIIWKARVKIIDRLLQSAVDHFIWPKKW